MQQNLNQPLYQTYRSKTQTKNDIDFQKFKDDIEKEIKQNWIGFKYLNQLEERTNIIINRLQEHSSQLQSGYKDLIIYCDFKFNENLDLLIKTSDIRQQFINQDPPKDDTNGKNNQPHLLESLNQIKKYMIDECIAFKTWLLKQQNSQGDIWNQAEWFLQNNNQKESEKIYSQCEKHRKNMQNKLNLITDNIDQYVDLTIYLNSYYDYFDRLPMNERFKIYQEFLEYLSKIQSRQDQTYIYNSYFKNNIYTDQKHQQQYIVNQPINSKNSISIPKHLWALIQKYDLYGYVLAKMIDKKEMNLNFQVIENIFLKSQRDYTQNHPKNVGKIHFQQYY